MNLSGLLEVLLQAPAYRDWLAQIERGVAEPAPQAIYHAARPFVVAGLKQHRPAPLLLVTARSEMAQQLVEWLSLWLPTPEAGGPAIYQFAEPDALPYERISWSGATRQRRLTAMAALQSRNGPAPLIVASARALVQKTLPARELRLALRTIKTGAAIRLETLAAGWVQTGYNPAELVEEPGFFTRRGGIVDIWPPNLPLPVRIDLFGEEIDSLRLFDPATQRTVQQVDSVEIGPGSEVLSKYGPMILERLRVHGEHLMAPENFAAGEAGGQDSPLHDPHLLLALREELRNEVEKLHASHSFHGIEWYMPYAYEPASTLLDHLPPEATVVVDDGLDLTATLQELELQAESLRIELERTGELPRNFGRSFVAPDDLRSRLLQRKPLLLGLGDLAGKATSVNTPLARTFAPGPRFGGKTKEIAAEVVRLHNGGGTILLASRQHARMHDLLKEVHVTPQQQTELLSPPPLGSVSLLHGVMGEGFVVRGLETVANAGELKGAGSEPTLSNLSFFHGPGVVWLEQAAGAQSSESAQHRRP
ncbi:MAG: hypothetical protein IPK16_06830 [Anaerolineales bacterium]|nr:hypothetical protein [Anaerolineales bacterium]